MQYYNSYTSQAKSTEIAALFKWWKRQHASQLATMCVTFAFACGRTHITNELQSQFMQDLVCSGLAAYLPAKSTSLSVQQIPGW